jgi:uncharacterized protein YbaP (TraB family)
MRICSLLRERKFRFLQLLILLAVTLSFTNAPYLPTTAQAKTKRSFLWSVENGTNTVYLLGSIHFLTSESYPLAVEIESAYKDSEKVVFETDIDGFNDPTFQSKMATFGLIPDGKTLQQYVSKETYSSLKRKVEKIALPMEVFDRLKPWLCGLTLTAMEVQRLGLNPNYGIDVHFFNKAKKDGKQMLFLESVDNQLRLFTEMSKEQEEEFLGQTLKDLELIETKLSEMINAWTGGDADGLESIVETSFKEHPRAYETMIVERNKNWVTQIENLMKQDVNALVIVGAGHLVGHENVLELLRGKGYKIEQR